ncbi:MAG: sugar phosphate isomerase/epimerase [Planctomycetaceae bacterium]|nr:sugar phosphate isomerase/epimerase [Planctomycetaceae bacterium]
MPATIACSTTSYGPFGPRAAITHLRSVGLQYLELPIHTHGQKTRYGEIPLLTSIASDQEIAEAQVLLTDHGVSLASCQIVTGNPLFKSARQVLRRKLEIAGQLGVKLVIGDAGEVQSPDQLPALYQALTELGDVAGSLGITYCLDLQPGICRNHRGMIQAMQDLDHPQIRLNFDTGSLFYYNDEPVLEIALLKVCPYIRHLNLKDCLGEYDYWYFPPLGYGGAVDFMRVHQVMRDMGFPAPLSIHVDGIEGERDLPLETYQKQVVDSVATLRECGYFNP